MPMLKFCVETRIETQWSQSLELLFRHSIMFVEVSLGNNCVISQL